MWSYEVYRPEHFGFEVNERNWKVFFALSSKAPAYVFNDTGYLVPIIETFRKKIGMDIVPIDMGSNTSKEDVLSATGIYSDGVVYMLDAGENEMPIWCSGALIDLC